jgi:hypothetical protein
MDDIVWVNSPHTSAALYFYRASKNSIHKPTDNYINQIISRKKGFSVVSRSSYLQSANTTGELMPLRQ